MAATQENVDSLSRRKGVAVHKSKIPISSLQETRNKAKAATGHESENQALTASIDDLENEMKSNLSAPTTSQKKRQYMLASKQPVKPKNEPDE